MKITVLGCGTSVGVPSLGKLGWGTCDPKNPKNRRQRSSVLVETNGLTILIDAGPDVRNQLLPLNIDKLDAILITHTHSDHISGLDEMRGFYFPDKNKVPVYTTIDHGKILLSQFNYLFEKKETSPSYFSPPLNLINFEINNTFEIGDIKIYPHFQKHGNSYSIGVTLQQQSLNFMKITPVATVHILPSILFNEEKWKQNIFLFYRY